MIAKTKMIVIVISATGIAVKVMPAMAIPLPLGDRLARIPSTKPIRLTIKDKSIMNIAPAGASYPDPKSIANNDMINMRIPKIPKMSETTACPSLSLGGFFFLVAGVGLPACGACF